MNEKPIDNIGLRQLHRELAGGISMADDKIRITDVTRHASAAPGCP